MTSKHIHFRTVSRQSDSEEIDTDENRIGKIKNFDTLADKLAKYASLTGAKTSDKHKTIFLANDEDESSDEDLDLSDETEDTFTRSELVDDDVDTVQRDQDFIEFSQSTNLEDILEIFSKIKERVLPNSVNNTVRANVSTFQETFPHLMEQMTPVIPHRYVELFRLLKTKSRAPEYKSNTAALGQNILIIGNNSLLSKMVERFFDRKLTFRRRSLRPKTCYGDAIPWSEDDLDRGASYHGQEQRDQALDLCDGGPQEPRGQETVPGTRERVREPHQHPDAANYAPQDGAHARRHRLHPGVFQEHPASGHGWDKVEGGHRGQVRGRIR